MRTDEFRSLAAAARRSRLLVNQLEQLARQIAAVEVDTTGFPPPPRPFEPRPIQVRIGSQQPPPLPDPPPEVKAWEAARAAADKARRARREEVAASYNAIAVELEEHGEPLALACARTTTLIPSDFRQHLALVTKTPTPFQPLLTWAFASLGKMLSDLADWLDVRASDAEQESELYANEPPVALCDRFLSLRQELEARNSRPWDAEDLQVVFDADRLTPHQRAARKQRIVKDKGHGERLEKELDRIAARLRTVAVQHGITNTVPLTKWRTMRVEAIDLVQNLRENVKASGDAASDRGLTVTEAADATNLPVSTISKACNSNPPTLRSTGERRKRRIQARDLFEWAKRQPRKERAEPDAKSHRQHQLAYRRERARKEERDR